MNWFWSILLAAVVLAGVFGLLRWMRGYTGQNTGLSWAGQQFDQFRDTWAGWRTRPRGPGPLGKDTQPIDPGPAAVPPPPTAAMVEAAQPAAVAEGGAPPVQVAQGDLLYAIHALYGMAISGDIHAVRRVIKTYAAAADGLAVALNRLGTRLAEGDRHYDVSIWEPLTQAGSNVRAGALHCGQADSSAAALLQVTVGELAASSRRAPHASQLNGGAG